MFHAEFLIDDKDVVKLHYALAAWRVFNVEVKPAMNAKPGKHGKAEEEFPGGGTCADRVALKLRADMPEKSIITRKTLFGLARDLGYTPNSMLATNLIKAKVLKKAKRGTFTLLPATS